MKDIKSITFILILLIQVALIPEAYSTKIYSKSHIDSLRSEIYNNLYKSPEKILKICDHILSDKSISELTQAEFLVAQAQAYNLKAFYSRSIITVAEAEQIYRRHNINDYLTYAEIYSIYSACYRSLECTQEALKYNTKAMTIYSELSDTINIAKAYNDRGLVFFSDNKFNEADLCFQKALEINRRKHFLQGIAVNLNNLCLHKNDLPKQLKYIDEAIIINKYLKKYWSLGENYNNLGRLYIYAGRYQEALEALSSARTYIEKSNAGELLMDNYEYMSDLLFDKKKYEEAYKYLKMLFNLKVNHENKNRIYIARKEIASKKIAQLEKEKMEQDKKYKEQLVSTALLTIFIIMCLLLMILLYTHNQYKRKKEIELAQKEKEEIKAEKETAKLKFEKQQEEIINIKQDIQKSYCEITDMAIFMNNRKSILEKILNEVVTARKMKDEKQKELLKDTAIFIRNCIISDENNSIVQHSISEYSQDYINRLKDRHPDITDGECNLAVMLRANISTKDISMLTGTAARSVNTNRYRLRKRLGLESNDNLTDYLQKI